MTLHDSALAAMLLIAAVGAWLDLRFRRLPNWLAGLAAVCGLVVAITVQQQQDVLSLMQPAPWHSNLAHAAIALVVGMGLFALRWFGGGDAKFYAGMAMWFPLGQAGALLMSVCLSGLVLLAGWFIIRRLQGKKLVARKDDESGKLPYGIAIALGAVLAFGV